MELRSVQVSRDYYINDSSSPGEMRGGNRDRRDSDRQQGETSTKTERQSNRDGVTETERQRQRDRDRGTERQSDRET